MDTGQHEQIQLSLLDIEAKEEQRNDLVTLSSGVTLKLKKIPILRVQEIMQRFRYPDPPKVYDKDKDRWYDNPDHPDYIARKEEIDSQRGLAVMDAVAALGTEVDSVPEGFQRPEDEEWIAELEFLQIPVVKDSKLARYYAWVKFVAIVDMEDMLKITEQFGVSLGASAAKIDTSLRDNFQDNS